MPSHARLSNAFWGFVMFDQLPPARRRFFAMGVLLAVVMGVYSSAIWADLPPEDQDGSSAARQLDSSPIEGPEFAPTVRKNSARGHAFTSPQTSADKTLLLDDDFEGAALDESVWNTCHWWNDDGCTIKSNDELEWYRPEQVTLSHGALHLTANRRHIVTLDGRQFSFASGMVTTGPPAHDQPPKLAFTYGTVEARIKLPEGQGLWPAIWLLPASEESRPEIDILEMRGGTPQTTAMHLHPTSRSAQSLGRAFHQPGRGKLTAGWHTIRLAWTPGRLVFHWDGKQIWEIVDDQVPNEPMYLVMNLAVGRVYAGPPNNATDFPADFAIGHVRIESHD